MQGSNYPSGGYINNYAILNGSGGVPATSPACNNASGSNKNVQIHLTNILK
jgi:hypothetical protein